MPTVPVSTRLDSEEAQLLDALAESSGVDRSTLLKLIVRRGLAELRMDRAVDEYRRERATLSRAAEIAGVDLWEFIARMGDHGLELHYGVDDLEADLLRLGDAH